MFGLITVAASCLARGVQPICGRATSATDPTLMCEADSSAQHCDDRRNARPRPNPHVLKHAGQFVVALFVFVKPLYYTQSCLASIFYTAGVLLIQQVCLAINRRSLQNP